MEKFNKNIYEQTIEKKYKDVVTSSIKRVEGKLKYAYANGGTIKACIFKGIDYNDETQAQQIIEYFENLEFNIHEGSGVYCIAHNFVKESININEEVPEASPPYIDDIRDTGDRINMKWFVPFVYGVIIGVGICLTIF